MPGAAYERECGSRGFRHRRQDCGRVAGTSLSPNQRAWARFKRNRLGYGALIVFVGMLVIATFAELFSNERPLVAKYQGEWFFPVFNNQPETRFGGDFLTPTDWNDPFIRQQFASDGNWALYTFNPYSAGTVNYFNKVPAPAPPSGENVLGTDDSGRDMIARLFYGFRISVWFGIALTFVGMVLGILIGSVQGYFGGRVDLCTQRLIEIWNSIPELYLLIIIASIFEPTILLRAAGARAVRVGRPVRLRARGIPAQPQSRVREGGARDGAVQLADHLAARAARIP